MIPERRRQFLIDRLKEVHTLSISEVADELNVSQMTVRRDIRALESEGHVVSISGGVRSAERILSEPPFQAKMRAEIGYKRAIARAAAELVDDDRSLYLDAGTTVFQIAPLIATRKSLSIVTNDFSTCVLLMDYPGVQLFHTGGRVEHANRSSVGSFASVLLESFNFDIAFISTSSFDLEHGVTTPSESKIVVKRTAMAMASRKVLVVDSTKYGHVGIFKVADLESFDHVITDDRLGDDVERELVRRGVAVVRVAEEGR